MDNALSLGWTAFGDSLSFLCNPVLVTVYLLNQQMYLVNTCLLGGENAILQIEQTYYC